MHRIGRLPLRALLRPSKHLPKPYRTQCTASSTAPPDPPNAKRLMEDPTNKHLRDEYHNAAGEVVFEHDPDKKLHSDDDWRKFEAAFGLDKPIPQEKIREWDAMTSDEPFKDDVPLGSGSVVMGPEDHQDQQHKREHKVDKKVVKKRSARRDAVQDSLRQPLHRRPGYEKRVASMEAEMSRLVTDVLVERTSDWYSAGADIERVMLSPNMRNLTVYYTVDDQPQQLARKQWRRLNKAMATQIHKKIFETMDVRYVPTVFFERVYEGDEQSTESALDSAFAQIEAERLAKSTKPV